MGLTTGGGAMSAEELLSACQSRFAGSLTEGSVSTGHATIVVERQCMLDVFRVLKNDPPFSFDMLVDATCVDYLGRTPRFEMVYHLRSLGGGHCLRVKVPLSEDDARVPSLVSLWRGANWLEREVWDMFGVRFDGHPDLRRILMYESFDGHPLRKDYPVEKRQPLVAERDPVEDPWGER